MHTAGVNLVGFVEQDRALRVQVDNTAPRTSRIETFWRNLLQFCFFLSLCGCSSKTC